MATSTQRMLIILLAINIFISLSIAIYEAPDTIDYGLFTETISIGEGSGTEIEGEAEGVNPENLEEETSYGSALSMTGTIFKLFIRGMVPLPVNTDNYNDPITKTFANALWLLRVFIAILICLEVVMFLKNKKAT